MLPLLLSRQRLWLKLATLGWSGARGPSVTSERRRRSYATIWVDGNTNAEGTRLFRTVFVCTGNQVRSPMAAAFFKARTSHLEVEVSSAGVANIPPVPSPWEARHAAMELGIEISEHRAKHLSAVDLKGADLVVGFELNHCATAVVEGDAQPEKTFGLLELVRILEAIPAPVTGSVLEGARQIIAQAHAHRSESDSFVPHEYIFDPIGGPLELYRETARSLRDLCDQLVTKLFEDNPARYVAG